MANLTIVARPEGPGVGFQLARRGWLGRTQSVPVAEWPSLATGVLALPLTRLFTWRDEGTAEATTDGIRVPHAVVAELSDTEAARFGLPPPPDLALHVEHRGTIDQPEFRVTHAWRTLGGRPVLGAERTGAWLRVGPERDHRVPKHLFDLIEAIEAFQALPPDDAGARWRAWARLRALLPDTASEDVQPDRYLTSFVIAHAGAFTLEPFVGADGFDIDPVLIGPKPSANGMALEGADVETVPEPAPLLPRDLHETFIQRRFRTADRARSHYTLKDGYHLVLDPDVQAALDVVRQVQRGPREARRAFARNPRAALQEALGGRLDDAAIERLFVETARYSERVRDLGVWQPPVLPWVQRTANDWFPDDPVTWPQNAGLVIDGRPVEIPPERVPEVRAAVEAAMARGEPRVTVDGIDVPIPATPATLEALGQLPGGGASERKASETTEQPERRVLQIVENFEDLGFERAPRPRADHGAGGLPSNLLTPPKPHQEEGLAWLHRAWRGGEPGVLLADDMGLGKTLQALAFLDRVRQAQVAGRNTRPFLVVAPTSLLQSWAQEHDRHLRAPGLGTPVKLWGGELKRRCRTDGGERRLDPEQVRRVDWLLTTYETLRDHHVSLAAVPFAVVVFDEAQKIKNPGSLATWAAKTLNADFVLALTGTPVENRLADLWSIADRAAEGLLGDLKTFSATYEAPDAPPERLAALKDRIAGERKDRAPFMLRRLKADRLKGLPEKRIEIREAPMPAAQAEAYRAALATARGGQKGSVLQALQALRAVSLHPLPPEAADDTPAFVAASARWTLLFDVLDGIAARREKALVFLETQALQPVLAAIAHQRYRLPEPPTIINGSVAGDRRQARVDTFQNAPGGFDLMILGPRAAGVGLTLTAANHVIHLSRWWNPAVEDQCTDRVYRIGQDRPVTVWLPQAIFPDAPERSFDRQLHQLLERKRALSRDLLAPPAATDQDVQDLFAATVG